MDTGHRTHPSPLQRALLHRRARPSSSPRRCRRARAVEFVARKRRRRALVHVRRHRLRGRLTGATPHPLTPLVPPATPGTAPPTARAALQFEDEVRARVTARDRIGERRADGGGRDVRVRSDDLRPAHRHRQVHQRRRPRPPGAQCDAARRQTRRAVVEGQTKNTSSYETPAISTAPAAVQSRTVGARRTRLLPRNRCLRHYTGTPCSRPTRS